MSDDCKHEKYHKITVEACFFCHRTDVEIELRKEIDRLQGQAVFDGAQLSEYESIIRRNTREMDNLIALVALADEQLKVNNALLDTMRRKYGGGATE